VENITTRKRIIARYARMVRSVSVVNKFAGNMGALISWRMHSEAIWLRWNWVHGDLEIIVKKS